MKKYRKRDLAIHAIQWDGNNFDKLVTSFPEVKFCLEADDPKVIGFYSAEGKLTAYPKCWIVKDAQGSIYPCQDDVFRMVYREEDDEDIARDKHEYLYEDERTLKIKVQSYPFNIRTHLTIETNFGEIRFLWDIPPQAEERVGDIIHRTYNLLINELYETHQNKGGSFPGDNSGAKDYFEKNRKTLIIKEPLLSKR